MVLSMYPHMYEFPINTIIAWIINDYHEQGNIIITYLLLPLGHISNRWPHLVDPLDTFWWSWYNTDYPKTFRRLKLDFPYINLHLRTCCGLCIHTCITVS